MQLFATGLIGEDGLAHCKGEGLVVGRGENAQLICRETECQATVPGSNLKLQFLNFYLGEVVSSAIQAFFFYVLLLYKVLIRQYVNLFPAGTVRFS